MIEIIIGIAAGILGGMGIGGGTILIPSLVIALGISQQVAQGTNLVYFIPTAISALIIHLKNKKLSFVVFIPLVIGGAIGAIIGSKFAISIEQNMLRKIFGVFLFVMGLYEITCKERKKKN